LKPFPDRLTDAMARAPQSTVAAKARRAVATTLSQVYEDLLLKMGEKNSDGGQFFTPREVVRAMVGTLAPIRQSLAACDRALRDAQARAAAIDAATFDLKAVNAHARVERDERTPTQVLAAIAGHGVAVDAALARLQALLATDDAPLR
jgi:hypothetical protein